MPRSRVGQWGDESSEFYVFEHGEVEVTVRRPGEASARHGPAASFGSLSTEPPPASDVP